MIEIIATRCYILRLKCTKFTFGWGSAIDLAGFKGSYGEEGRKTEQRKGKKGKTGKEKKEGEGKGGRREGDILPPILTETTGDGCSRRLRLLFIAERNAALRTCKQVVFYHAGLHVQ